MTNSKLPDISRHVLSLCSKGGGASVLQRHLSDLLQSLFYALGPREEKDANICQSQSSVRLQLERYREKERISPHLLALCLEKPREKLDSSYGNATRGASASAGLSHAGEEGPGPSLALSCGDRMRRGTSRDCRLRSRSRGADKMGTTVLSSGGTLRSPVP